MLNLIERVQDHLSRSRKSWAPAGNYASQAGHPCERNLVYQRLNWQDKVLPSPERLMIFREGNLHESAVLTLLTEAGLVVIEQQRPFEWKELQVRGRIDGRVKHDGKNIPLEIKSSNPFDFARINSVEDMIHSPKHWVRGYVTQMMLYLLMSNEEEGIILLKNKVSGELKQINVRLDYEYAERAAKVLDSVNQHVAKETYPERIADRSVCQFCDFRHICLPDEASDSLHVEDNAEILEMLEERERLKEAAKSYEDIDAKLREIWKVKELGTYLIGNKFQVKITSYKRPFFNVPEDVKAKFKEESEITKTVITKLK